jgi:hypothetical protein
MSQDPREKPRSEAIAASEPLLRGKSTPLGGLVLSAVGALVVAGGLWGALTGEEQVGDALALVGLAAVFGGGLVAAGLLLVAEKGGVRFERGPADGCESLAFRGAGAADALIVPTTSVTGLRLVPREEVWGRQPTTSWSCELLRAEGAPPLVLAESADYEGVWTAGRAVERRLSVPLRERGSWAPPPAAAPPGARGAEPAGRRTVRVRRGGPLTRTLLFLGVAAAVVGGVLMSQVEREPIFGFLFGPTLLFLGLAFLVAAGSGVLATDLVTWDERGVRRQSRLGALAWGAKDLPRSEPAYLRVHHRGLVGASLEWVGRERTLVLVGGVTRASGLGYHGLLALAADLTAALGAGPPVPDDEPGDTSDDGPDGGPADAAPAADGPPGA